MSIITSAKIVLRKVFERDFFGQKKKTCNNDSPSQDNFELYQMREKLWHKHDFDQEKCYAAHSAMVG